MWHDRQNAVALLSGGECTVTVRGNGKGGRCSAFLLSLASRMAQGRKWTSGAGVLATRSIEVARSHNVRLHVRSSFEEGTGTWIQEEDETMSESTGLEKALISGVVHQRGRL